jgi:hypothetical protein
VLSFGQFLSEALTKNQRRTGFGERGYRGFGGKYYAEYGFIDSQNGKVIKGAGNGDHEMLARTALQIKGTKNHQDSSQIAIMNGFIRYIISPQHEGIFHCVNQSSSRHKIVDFMHNHPNLTTCLITFEKPNSNGEFENIKKLNRDDLDDLISGDLSRYNYY